MKMYRILGKRGSVNIPYEIRKNAGMGFNDILSFEVKDSQSILVKKEKICDESHMPKRTKEQDEEVTLLEFLNSLTEEQQQAALVHLSVKWAEKKEI